MRNKLGILSLIISIVFIPVLFYGFIGAGLAGFVPAVAGLLLASIILVIAVFIMSIRAIKNGESKIFPILSFIIIIPILLILVPIVLEWTLLFI